MLTRAHLVNFQSHRDTSIELAPITILLGKNGSGKSGFLRALTWGLLGANHLTAADGKGADVLRTIGSDQTNVQVTVDGWGIVERVLGKKHRLLIPHVDEQPLSVSQAAILNRFGVPYETMQALLDVKPLSQRSPAERKDILLKVLRPPTIQPTPRMREVGLGHIQGVEHLNRLIKEYKEEKRRDLNREKVELETKGFALPAWPFPEHTEEDLRELLKKTRADRDTANQRLGGLTVIIGKDEKALEIPAEPPPEYDPVTLRQTIVNDQASLASWEGDLEDLMPQIQQRAEIVARCISEAKPLAREQRELFEKVIPDKHCDTCKCPLDAMRRERDARLDKIKARLTDLSVEGQKAMDQQKVFEARQKVLSGQVKDKRNTIESRQQRLAEVLATIEARKTAEPRDVTQRRLDETRSRHTDLEKEIAEFNESISQGEKCLERISIYYAAKRDAEKASARHAELEQEIPKVTRVIEDMENLRQSIIAQGAGPFLDSMRGFVEYLGLDPKSLNLDPETGFSYRGLPSGPGLSQGQQDVFLEAAFRVAAAQHTKVPLVLLDQTAPVDDEARKMLQALLAGSGCQVIIAWTTSVRPAQNLDMPGVLRYWVENVHNISQVEAA